MRNALTDLAEGRPYTAPGNVDEINDSELPNGIGTPLADAAARSDHLLAEIIGLYEKVGEKPFQWYRWNNTTDAVLGNSYTHPRAHVAAYMRENGDAEGTVKLIEEAVPEMLAASDTPAVHAIALYNLACVRVMQKRLDDALDNLEQALGLRSEMKESAARDEDLAPLRDDPRFQKLITS